jgi:hypothetical protein
MVLAPTGPVGWFVIGILLLVDVVLIGVVIEDLAQNHTPPMSTVNSNQSHTLKWIRKFRHENGHN